jgi:[acyl-carrier-protein] S-malonyltransferase
MGKIALVFPGQGSQHIGMGVALRKESHAAKDTIDEASDVLGYDMHKLYKQGSITELNRMEIMFPAIMTVGVASFRTMYEQLEVEVSFLAGHSLGEYTALVCSGAVSFPDMLRVVRKRGQLAQKIADAGIGFMSIVDGVPGDQVLLLCDQVAEEGRTVSVSAFNSQRQVTISGVGEDVEFIESELIRAKAAITPLFFSAPFHCGLMQQIVGELEETLNSVDYQPLLVPVVANIDARPYPSEKAIVEYLCLQIVRPVQWKATLDFFAQEQVDRIFDMGPQAILANLSKQNNSAISVYCFAQEGEREALRRAIPQKWQGSDNGKRSVYNIVTRCMAMAVSTRNANDNEQEYQHGVIKPYERMEALQHSIEQSGTAPTEEQIGDALVQLRSIFQTKHVPESEQIRRYEVLLSEQDACESRIVSTFLNTTYPVHQ